MKQRLLIIEDDEVIRENVAEMLEMSGFEVYTAENGIVGVKMAREKLPDLIICDVMMPELDGYGVIYSLAKDPEMAHIPFIFLTAKAGTEDLRKGMRLGADDYLIKPFEASELLASIDTRLKKSALIKDKYSSDFEGLQNLGEDTKSISNLETVLSQSETINTKKKDTLYREGTLPRNIYYIKKGSVKTIKLHEDGKELMMDLLKEGDFFGIVSVMTKTEYQHSAVCLEDSEIVTISTNDFDSLLESNAEVATKIIKIFAGNIEHKELELLEIAYGTVRSRVAEGIISLSETYADSLDDGLPLTRAELAQYVGIATETLIRTVADFKDENLIETNGRKIVPNIEKLRQLKY